MGSQVIAKCKCGVDAEILIGGGMSDFTTVCYFPYFCSDCNNVVQASIYEKNPQCPECDANNIIPYNDQRVIGDPGDDHVVTWDSLILSNGTYKCPQCNNMTLHFYRGGMLWD